MSQNMVLGDGKSKLKGHSVHPQVVFHSETMNL